MRAEPTGISCVLCKLVLSIMIAVAQPQLLNVRQYMCVGLLNASGPAQASDCLQGRHAIDAHQFTSAYLLGPLA